VRKEFAKFNEGRLLVGSHKSRLVICLGYVVLTLHVGLLGWFATKNSPTQDEVAHLPSGLAIWRFGRSDLYRVNPPLVRAVAAIPVLFAAHDEDWDAYRPDLPTRQEWNVGKRFIVINGRHSLWLFVLARWVCIPFSLLGACVCWRWARELSGDLAGLLALSLWCFSPNILGHASLITPDIASVAFGLLAAWRFQQWLQRSDGRNAFLAGMTLGLALLTKTYWIFLLVLWPFIWLIYRHLQFRKSEIWQLLALLLLGMNLLNMGYGFQGSFKPLGSYNFYSQALSGEIRNPETQHPANRFAETWMGQIPVPVPMDYVTGIDLQKLDFERGRWNYMFGESKQSDGWWYFYLLALVVKTPVGTLGLFALGFLCSFKSKGTFWRSTLSLWLPALFLLVLASSQTTLNRHLRYVFPVLPVLFLLASQSLESGKWGRYLAAIGLMVTIVSSLAVVPRSLSFFNVACGGSNQGYRYLVDSNLNWGQDIPLVERWLEEHPQSRPLKIAWLAVYDLDAIGIDLPPAVSPPFQPGWYIIGANRLVHPNDHFAQFRKIEPVDRIGSGFFVYYLDHSTPQIDPASP